MSPKDATNLKGNEMADRKYKVVKEFKYNGVVLKPGDTWQPTPEGLYDDRIMSNEKYVKPILTADELKAEAKTKDERNEMMRRKKTNKGGKLAAKPKKKQTPKPKTKAKTKAKAKVKAKKE